MIGMGIYHTGIEINGSEYAYGGNSLLDATGVYEIAPTKHDAFSYKEALHMGRIESKEAVWKALSLTMKKYKANEYDMLMFNCNHFSDEFLSLLLPSIRLPPHLNRAANIGSKFHCLIPKKYLIVTP